MAQTKRALVCLFSLGILAAVPCLGRAQPRQQPPAEDQTFPWAEEILLRPNILFKKLETGTRRWVEAPKLSVFGGTQDQQQIVTRVVEHVNESLRLTSIKGIEILEPNDMAATLKVQFVKRSKIATIAGELGASADEVKVIAAKKWSYFQVIYPGSANKWEIRGGVMLLASDGDDATVLRHNVLFSICYNLGFMNRSKRFENSVFYRDGYKESTATKLSDLDRKLLVWYYSYVPPGTETLKALYDERWIKGNE